MAQLKIVARKIWRRSLIFGFATTAHEKHYHHKACCIGICRSRPCRETSLKSHTPMPPPQQRSRPSKKPPAIRSHALAPRFHHQLLQKRRHAPQTRIVRKNPMVRKSPKIAIPYAQQPHHDRNIFFQRCFLKMPVRSLRTLEKLLEQPCSQQQLRRKADRRPYRVASSDARRQRKDTLARQR